MRALAVPALIALACLAGCQRDGEPHAAVNDAVVRLPAVNGRPASGYFKYKTIADQGALLAVTSPDVTRIELHESMRMGEMMSMKPMERMQVVSKELVLQPGGKHLMLFGLRSNAKAGDTITFTLRFERPPEVTVNARLFAAGDTLPGYE